MPIRRKAYSFKAKVNITPRRTTESAASHQGAEQGRSGESVITPCQVPSEASSNLRSRSKSFISKRCLSTEREQLGLRSSVRLRSFRKRKMADRDDTENKVESRVKARKLSNMGQEDIQRRIDDQIRMRDGVMKLMSACSNFKQTIDASKNYLTINARVLALMSALQKKKSELVLMEYNKTNSQEDDLKPCLGNLTISDIRVPLMWKDGAHFRGKTGGEQLYFMFCLLKLGNQVYDTSLKQVDVSHTDVNFPEIVTFEDVNPDFKLHFEIYYTVTSNPDYHMVTPIRTPRKGAATFSAPNYCLAGHTQFTVAEITDTISTFDVAMGGKGASATTALGQADELPDNELDLWGQICCSLSARPKCMVADGLSGQISLQDTSSSQHQWTEHYCVLRHCSIEGWKMPHNAVTDCDRPSDCSIKLKPTMSISQTNLPGLNQEHVLIIASASEENEPVLAFASNDDMQLWKNALQQDIVNASAWKHACEKFMERKKTIKPLMINTSMRLYDQIKLDDVQEGKVKASSPGVPKSTKNGSVGHIDSDDADHVDDSTSEQAPEKRSDESNKEIPSEKSEVGDEEDAKPITVAKVQTDV